MYGLSDRLKPLSAAEEQVLLALWDCPAPATRRDISEKLGFYDESHFTRFFKKSMGITPSNYRNTSRTPL